MSREVAPLTDETLRSLMRPRDGEPSELAEIRVWLGDQPRTNFWGLTVATRMAYLLQLLDQERLLEKR